MFLGHLVWTYIVWLLLLLLEKAMAFHSSTLAWKIPWREEPGRLQSMGSLRVRHWRLRNFTFTFHFHALEKEMALHSSVRGWRIPGTGQPGGLPSMGSHRVGHDWSDLAAAWDFPGKSTGMGCHCLLQYSMTKVYLKLLICLFLNHFLFFFFFFFFISLNLFLSQYVSHFILSLPIYIWALENFCSRYIEKWKLD